MKKIVNGTVYDTEMAAKVVSHDTESGWAEGITTHFSVSVTETLYRTKNGNWFLIRERRGVLFEREPVFLPMTEEEAYNWLHRFNEIELLRQYFRDRVLEG